MINPVKDRTEIREKNHALDHPKMEEGGGFKVPSTPRFGEAGYFRKLIDSVETLYMCITEEKKMIGLYDNFTFLFIHIFPELLLYYYFNVNKDLLNRLTIKL